LRELQIEDFRLKIALKLQIEDFRLKI